MIKNKKLRLLLICCLVILGYKACKKSPLQKKESPNRIIPSEPEAEAFVPMGISPAIPPKTLKKWEEMEGLIATCEDEPFNLALPVNIIAFNISRDSLQYGAEPLSDCSGIFHRFLDSLELRCPEPTFPNPKKYRSSRDLARWYMEQDRIIRVEDPLEMDEHIIPGAVMFYGGRGINTAEMDMEDLVAPGGINHMGVVVSVERNKKGRVTAYSLFHGRRPGKLASITRYHRREYRNRPEYPPYGNGTEQWVAVAELL